MYIEQAEKFEETLDQIEKMVVEDLYDNQFTVDELQDGIDGDKYFETLITEVSGANEDTAEEKINDESLTSDDLTFDKWLKILILSIKIYWMLDENV
ncbi:hypothetical protein AABD41_00130 [Staphylococcus pseudoxylosus]|uniref:phage tail assembly chaperone G n=1 Tax=Staphylococcus pseudoxylosus TaxID=2282419 RepID=UPI00398BAE36